MKNIFRSQFGSLLAVASFVAATSGYVFAQDTTDEQVMLQAIEQTTPTPADEVPIDGQFHSAAHPEWPPLPGNIYNVPAWGLGDNVWLLDDLSMDSMSSTMMTMDSLDPGDGDTNGYGGYTNSFVSIFSIIDTNGLWLEITNVYDGWSYLNLHNGTNQVYAIWGTTDLLSSWNVETELWPVDDQTNIMPFNIQNKERDILFLKAEDWTGVYLNGLPCWWTWLYFGTLEKSASDWDSTGLNTLGDDFTNSVDPNVISFTAYSTNSLVSQSTVPVEINIQSGVPSSYAVLVNDANTADADWQNYIGNHLSAVIGSTDGVYSVSIGLRGLPQVAQQTWRTIQITRDTVPPTLVITNPTVNTITQPMIQLQGYASKPLSAVSFDVSNALVVVNNQVGSVTGHYFDPASAKFTLSWFECNDIGLTNGLNTITLRATDKAGNTSTTNFNITVDYSTATNPVVQVYWPSDGGQICADNFTCYGRLDDPTATVTAQITDADGNVSTLSGEVERSGNFWLEYLPLSEGTNYLTLSVTNAAGFSTTTNLVLFQSSETLTMNPPLESEMWDKFINVTGTVSDATCQVWVNDVEGVNNGDGTWYALNVPASVGGTASFNLKASFPSGTSMNNTNIEKPSRIIVAGYYLDWTTTFTPTNGGSGGGGFGPLVVMHPAAHSEHFHMYWQYDTSSEGTYTVTGPGLNCTTNYEWPPDKYILGVVYPTLNGFTTNTCSSDQGTVGPPTIQLEHCNIATTNIDSGGTNTFERVAQTVLVLETGGKLLSHRNNLYQISGSAFAITNIPTLAGETVPSTLIEMGVLGMLGADSNLWVALPDNRGYDMTPWVTSTLDPDYYTFTAGQAKFKPHILLSGVDVTDKTTRVIIGQKISLTTKLEDADNNVVTLPSITGYNWNVSGIIYSDYVATVQSATLYTNVTLTQSNVDYYWANSGVCNAGCDVTVLEGKLFGNAVFNVVKPIAKIKTFTTSVNIDTFFSPNSLCFLDTNTFNPGITFSNTFKFPTGFSGNTEWVQIVTSPYRIRRDTNSVWWQMVPIGSPPYLDTEYPYGAFLSGVPVDGPRSYFTSQYNELTVVDSFRMWLMFKPTGGQWAPVSFVDWNWRGTATLSGTNWILSNPDWSHSPSGAYANGSFPVWNSNITNATYQIIP